MEEIIVRDFKIKYEAETLNEAEFYYYLSRQYFFYLGFFGRFGFSMKRVGHYLLFELKSIETHSKLFYFLWMIYWLSKKMNVIHCEGSFNDYETHIFEGYSIQGRDVMGLSSDGKIEIKQYISIKSPHFVSESILNARRNSNIFSEKFLLFFFENLWDKLHKIGDINIKSLSVLKGESETEKNKEKNFIKYYNGIFQIFQEAYRKINTISEKDGEVQNITQDIKGAKHHLVEQFANALSDYKEELSFIESELIDFLSSSPKNDDKHYVTTLKLSDNHFLYIHLNHDDSKDDYDFYQKFVVEFEEPRESFVKGFFEKVKNGGIVFEATDSKKMLDISRLFLSDFDYNKHLKETSHIAITEGVVIPLTSYFVNLFSVPSYLSSSNHSGTTNEKVINLQETLLSTNETDSYYPKLFLKRDEKNKNVVLKETLKEKDGRISICDICTNRIRKNIAGCKKCNFEILQHV